MKLATPFTAFEVPEKELRATLQRCAVATMCRHLGGRCDAPGHGARGPPCGYDAALTIELDTQ